MIEYSVDDNSSGCGKMGSFMDDLASLGKKDYYLPVNLSDKPIDRLVAAEHPIERFEQIFMDMIIKWKLFQPSERKSFKNYIRQCKRICHNCSHWDESLNLCKHEADCRVDNLYMNMSLLFDQQEFAYRYGRQVVAERERLLKVIRKWRNNRWNWKIRALRSRWKIANFFPLLDKRISSFREEMLEND